MKPHLRKTILFFIALSFGFSMANLEAQIKLKTESELKDIFVPVFCYHRVTPDIHSLYDLTPEMLESQLQYLKDEGYHPITGLQYIKLQKNPEFIPDKPVILTFDDGSKGHYQYAFPLLKKYGFLATFFVYPNVVFQDTKKMITWPELAEMAQAGMDIESHTMSHAYLTKPGADPAGFQYLQWLSEELRGSKTVLEQKLNRKISLLGYPYGWYNRVVEAEAARAGYEGAFTVNWGVNRLDENPFRIKRRVISNNLRREDFERYLSSRPLSLEIIAPPDAALFTEKPVIRFRVVQREVELVDITVRDEKGTVRSDPTGAFTFDNYELRWPGYYQITISGFDDQKRFYQSSWGFDYRPIAATPSPTFRRAPEVSPSSSRK
ncbi:MAG: polysaccharide deacetylase family protein [Firmicutes bacterium]|nr:polysaccharide deacetylase family protein [Bacillota bacterium]